MKFVDLAANLDKMEATRSRNELVRILSDVYRASSVDELEPITYLIQGRLAPFFEPVEIGLGERLLITAIAAAYGVPKEDVVKLNRQTGDLGLTVQGLAPASHCELEFEGCQLPGTAKISGRGVMTSRTTLSPNSTTRAVSPAGRSLGSNV